ncbi:MAG: thioredoxin-disulfide reductase [Planctomycetota bacterium]|nr:thioredoxin-disulfide reductase [Planctomycetota bacterium]
MSDGILKTLIIGSGPAGLTAAIYAARAALKPVVLAGADPGGQLTKTSLVENYPGFAKGVDGPKLMADMLEQAKWNGAELKWESAAKIEGQAPPYTVTTSAGEVLRAHTVLFCTGAAPRRLGVKGELEYQPRQKPDQKIWGEGVTYCAVCDGNFYRKLPVAVIGGGDSAMEEANYLSNICGEVTLIHRREGFRASTVMLERARSKKNIKWELNQLVDEVLGNEEAQGHKRKVTALRLKDARDGSTKELKVDGVFIAVGHIPTTQVLQGVVKLDASGYIEVDDRQHTSREGFFAAGDCHDSRYRQAVTAAGMGCKAALEAERYLAERGLS